MEQLTSAGIDVENINDLTEDQITNLLALTSQTSSASGMSAPKSEHLVQARQRQQMQDQQQALHSSRDHLLHQQEAAVDSSDDSLTMVIGDDGSLKLCDGSGQELVLSASQLATNGIDVNALSDEQIQHIVQLALPVFELGREQQEPMSKRFKLSNDELLSVAMVGSSKRGRMATTGQRGNLTLIGAEVDVRKDGKNQPATIRYYRQRGGYKVQFEDGHFEWVSEDQIELRAPKLKSSHTDHTAYSSGDHQLSPTARNGLGSGGIGRRLPPAIPGIKVSSLIDKEGQTTFCCPICTRKVRQKEPVYIVIRLPACESCADSKILVLDQEGQSETSMESRHEPQDTVVQ